MNGTDQIVAAIRTAVAGAVGALITWLATRGIDAGAVQAWLEVTLFLGFTGVYNVAVNWLQARYGKAWGFLLLIPKLPNYNVESASDAMRPNTDR